METTENNSPTFRALLGMYTKGRGHTKQSEARTTPILYRSVVRPTSDMATCLNFGAVDTRNFCGVICRGVDTHNFCRVIPRSAA